VECLDNDEDGYGNPSCELENGSREEDTMMKRKTRWVPALAALCFATVCTAQPAWPWETNVIDEGPVIGPSSLVVDGSNNVHIVYRDELSHELKYATNSAGPWEIAFIDPPPCRRHAIACS
jgi:hypothetical protein